MKYDGNTDKIENIRPTTIYNNSFQYLASDLHFNDNANLTENKKIYSVASDSCIIIIYLT